MKCFYHKADWDGRCSGAIVKIAHPGVELFGIDYGEVFPFDAVKEGEKVIMVDFCLQPFYEMVRLRKACSLVWIDHHKSAIEAAKEACFDDCAGVRSTDKAACELAWDYFNPGQHMPQAVYLLGRYDVWKHEGIKGCLEFQYGMRIYDASPGDDIFWRSLFSDVFFVQKLVYKGADILRYENVNNQKYLAACAFETEIDGLRCIAVNKGLTSSQVFKSQWNPEKYDAMMSFCWRAGRWTVSLYSDKPGVDVSVICKARGGGGHKGAAGFQVDDIREWLRQK